MLADHYDAFLLDLDGTLYRGERPVEGAPETVHRLHAEGKRVVFLTNNSGRTREETAHKLRGLGIEAHADEVVSSAVATAELLASRGVRTVFPLCGAGLRQELTQRGIELIEEVADGAEVVVIGWDSGATYERFRDAGLLVQRGAALVASNADASYPASDGLWPGAGALLAVVTTTTGAEAEIVGKPNAPLFEAALGRSGGTKPLVVGDRLDTDIAGATALGWDNLLVYSGVAQPRDPMPEGARPTFTAASIAALFDDPEPLRLEGA